MYSAFWKQKHTYDTPLTTTWIVAQHTKNFRPHPQMYIWLLYGKKWTHFCTSTEKYFLKKQLDTFKRKQRIKDLKHSAQLSEIRRQNCIGFPVNVLLRILTFCWTLNFTCVSEDNLARRKLKLVEFWDRICWPGLEADHSTMWRWDGECQVGVRTVIVSGTEVVIHDGDTGARPHGEAGVVDYLGDGIIDRCHLDLEGGGDAGLVLVRPLQPHRPRHQHEAVLQGIAAIMDILKHQDLG